MMMRRLSLVLALVASFATGCSETSTPTAPESIGNSLTLSEDSLSGSWHLVSIEPAGRARQNAPSGAAVGLTFADGRLSVGAGCNTCVGAYTLSGRTLTAGPALACTRMACAALAFETSYTALLSGEHTVTLSGDSLVLSSSRGTLRFAR
jgi:heat shock protein HslJ